MDDTIRPNVFVTELGWICAAWRDQLLLELTFGHSSPTDAVHALRHVTALPVDPNREERKFIERVQRFAADASEDLSNVPLELGEHTEFQRRIVKTCQAIPPGETLSYGELARRAGHPGAARAAGRVMATNRFPLVVPCHRVVGAGSIGGFSAPNGLAMKRRLLELESRPHSALQAQRSLLRPAKSKVRS